MWTDERWSHQVRQGYMFHGLQETLADTKAPPWKALHRQHRGDYMPSQYLAPSIDLLAADQTACHIYNMMDIIQVL